MKPSERIKELQRDIQVQGINGIETIKDPDDFVSAVIKYLDEQYEKEQERLQRLVQVKN